MKEKTERKEEEMSEIKAEKGKKSSILHKHNKQLTYRLRITTHQCLHFANPLSQGIFIDFLISG